MGWEKLSTLLVVTLIMDHSIMAESMATEELKIITAIMSSKGSLMMVDLLKEASLSKILRLNKKNTKLKFWMMNNLK